MTVGLVTAHPPALGMCWYLGDTPQTPAAGLRPSALPDLQQAWKPAHTLYVESCGIHPAGRLK